MDTIVAYHAECTDGFAAAFAAWKRFGNRGAQYVAVDHGDSPLPEWRDSELYLLDFTFPHAELNTLAACCKSITVIDHTLANRIHLLEPSDCGWAIRHDLPSNVSVVFDADRAGSALAWKHFHCTEAPHVLKVVEDYDQWRFTYPDTSDIILALRSFPYNFDLWDSFLTTNGLDNLRSRGAAIRGFLQLQMEKITKRSCIETKLHAALGGFDVRIINAPFFLVSDLGENLAIDRPFAAVFQVVTGSHDGEARVRVSLRSSRINPEASDVSEIARRFGGGGHRNSAAFECSLARFCELFGLS